MDPQKVVLILFVLVLAIPLLRLGQLLLAPPYSTREVGGDG